MLFLHGLKTALAYFKANCAECQERSEARSKVMRIESRSKSFIRLERILKFISQLTSRDALGASINVQQQPEFSVCFYPGGVIVDS